MDAAGLLAAKQLREVTLHVQVEGDAVPLLLRALPRKEYRELVDAHPGDDDKDWNADTFPPALIAASVVEPEFSLDQATQLWETWEDEEAVRIFLACFNLNENKAGLAFILPGSAKTGGSGQNSTTASTN